MASTDKFPVPKFQFKVEIPDATGFFQEVTGLQQENEFLEYRTGASKKFITEKRAGMSKSGTVSFKKGVFKSDKALSDLYNKVADKKTDFFSKDTPKNITVTLLDETDAAILIWKIEGAVPVKLSNGDLKADENALAIEQIDFVHSGIVLTVN